MSSPAPVIIAVLAHNEERRITRCLDSLPVGEAGYDVHVVVNGSSDRTADIARNISGVTVHEYQQGGKSRSWNRFVLDTPGIEARHFVFVDGDTRIQPGSISALLKALDNHPINAASALPSNGRKFEHYREEMRRQNGLFGDLYALNGDFLRRLRDSGLRLPEDLVGDDALIGALAKTDLGHEREWENARVMPVEEAGFLCYPVALTPADLALQARRMRNYSVRHFQNQIISQIMRGDGPQALPARLADIYPQFLPQFSPRKSLSTWWFDRQALAQMRRAAG